ncbi:MAG TPA: hypothetical protein VKU02_30745 [Gemmataceae bacterium]|nr:hypothetical protein [Gemmataceae bacterium]
MYGVKHGSAPDLASALSALFKGDVEVQAIVSSDNCPLLSGKPDAIDEATAVLSRLDRRPRSLIIEVVIAEAAKKGEVEAESGELNVGTFTGPAESVLVKVQTLRMKGQLTRVKRIRLSALENQTTFAQQMQTPDFQAMVQVTSSVSPDQVVTTRLSVEEARLRAPEGSGTPNKGSSGDAPVFSWQGTLRVPSGQATVAEEIQTNSKSSEEKTWVIVVARVVEPEPDRQK